MPYSVCTLFSVPVQWRVEKSGKQKTGRPKDTSWKCVSLFVCVCKKEKESKSPSTFAKCIPTRINSFFSALLCYSFLLQFVLVLPCGSACHFFPFIFLCFALVTLESLCSRAIFRLVIVDCDVSCCCCGALFLHAFCEVKPSGMKDNGQRVWAERMRENCAVMQLGGELAMATNKCSAKKCVCHEKYI